MKLYCRVDRREAGDILRRGFTDREGFDVSGKTWRGVPLYDRAPDAEDGAAGDVVLVVDVPDEVVAEFEWFETAAGLDPNLGHVIREFHPPAAIVNGYLVAEEKLTDGHHRPHAR